MEMQKFTYVFVTYFVKSIKCNIFGCKIWNSLIELLYFQNQRGENYFKMLDTAIVCSWLASSNSQTIKYTHVHTLARTHACVHTHKQARTHSIWSAYVESVKHSISLRTVFNTWSQRMIHLLKYCSHISIEFSCLFCSMC